MIAEGPRSSAPAPAPRRAVLMMLLRPFSFAAASTWKPSSRSGWQLGELQALEIERMRRLRFSHRPLIGILASTPPSMRRHLFGSLEGMGLIGSEWRDEYEAASEPPESQLRVRGMPTAE